MDERIKYWTQGWPEKNFGDFLTEYLHDLALTAPLVEADRYRLIGSAIDSSLLREDLRQCGAVGDPAVVLWGCGKRDREPLDPSVKSHCLFFGVRGPLTRDALELPGDTPLGDPAFILPLLREPASPAAGGTLCVPHYNEPVPGEELRKRAGADFLLTPRVADMAHLEALIDRISGASFVLAGSLHAAIVACAYGVPFGFWDTGFVDVPFKWQDFAASLDVKVPFSSSVDEAKVCYETFGPHIRRPSVAALLATCPFAVRPSLLARAWAREAGLERQAEAAVLQVAGAKDEENARIAMYQGHNARRRAERRARTAATYRGPVVASAQHLSTVAQRLDIASRRIEAEVRAATFNFEAAGADLKFSEGSAGMPYLRRGWTTPNEVGPWAVERYASIELPVTTQWWKAVQLEIGAIVFVPHAMPVGGRRVLRVSGNDIPLGHFTIENGSGDEVVFKSLSLPLPELLTRRGGDLSLIFESDVLVSAKTMGIGRDDRTLSFAPTYMKALTH